MAERFYGITSEDSSSLFNYNGLPQSQILNQNSSFLGQSSNNLISLDYPGNSSSGYFASNMNGFNNSNSIDPNNNSSSSYNRNMRFYNQQNPNSSSNYNMKNCLQPKMMNVNINYSQHNLMNNTLLNVPTNYGNIMTTADYQHHMEPSTVGSLSSGGICHYAYLNGSATCNTRNRYMPYNHNRTCAAANSASAAAAVQQQNCSNNSLSNLTSYQQFVPVFYNGSNGISGVPNMNNQFNNGCTPTNLYNLNKSSGVGNSIYEKPSLISNPLSSSESLPSIVSTAAQSTMQVTSTTNDNYFKASNANPNPVTTCSTIATTSSSDLTGTQFATATSSICSSNEASSGNVTLQITNLDYSMDEPSLRNFLLNQLKPITPVVSLVFEGSSFAKVTVPDLYFAKQVVSNLHRKKIGHKRMLVSYTRDSSLTEINTLRCQVAGLLKDVPYYTLPMYKFRELFQSRFKTSISVLDLYKMQDICTINSDNNDEKFISLQPDLVNSLECSPLIEGLQHSVPYCTIHFKREQHKGWADQDIEPLPNVFMTISEIQQIIYPLLKKHHGEIPVASLVHCVEGELNIQIQSNDNGVNLEHLICCVQGIQIQVNNFGIKILGWLELNKEKDAQERNAYAKNSTGDPLFQISKEVIELIKMSPKSTMKFSRFIPAYHNHFGKQCRVADYGYTKLIELFEALSSVVQILGDGENRQITLTHRTQIRRFTSDLLRVLRAHGNNSVLLSQLPTIYAQTQNRTFDVTDYGVCDIVDILDGLVNSNVVVLSTVQQGKDILISIPKRKQTLTELERTCIFAGEMVELFRNAVQYTILFQKFVRSYHYHFAYQCRLSDYGFMKLADLMESIHGVVEMETTNDEDKKICLSSKMAIRVFAEQCEELIRTATGSSKTCMELEEALKLHKKKYGYQMQPQTLGVKTMMEAIELMPYVEWYEKEGKTWIICHNEDTKFRSHIYCGMRILLTSSSAGKQTAKTKSPATENVSPKSPSSTKMPIYDFLRELNEKCGETLTETNVKAMKQSIEIFNENETKHVRLTPLSDFVVQVVCLLEQRSKMHLNDIKNMLDVGLTSTFKFGFPNLFTLLSAYGDVFSVVFGATPERCEVSLKPNYELRIANPLNQQNLFPAMKANFNKQQKPIRSNRAPLTERLPNQGPPAKGRCMSLETSVNNNSLNINNNTNNNNNNNNNNINNNNNNLNSNNNIFNTKQSLNSQFQNSIKTIYTNNHRYHNQQPLMNSSFNTKYNTNNCTASNSNNNNNNLHSLNSSIYSSNQSSLLNSSMSNISSSSNKENSFNNSMNLLNGSFNSSGNASFISDNSFTNISGNFSLPINSSVTAPNLPPPSSTFLVPAVPANQQLSQGSNFYSNLPQPSANSKLWDRRHSFCNNQSKPSDFYNPSSMQQMPPSSQVSSMLSNTFCSSLGLTNTAGNSDIINHHFNNITPQDQNGYDLKSSIDDNNNHIPNGKQTDLYDIVNNLKMCPAFEPPKPDTPPSDSVPFWIDPIWSNNKDSDSNNDLANIRLPDMKPVNTLPTLLSPYSLSKAENLKQQFNFGAQDRKIA